MKIKRVIPIDGGKLIIEFDGGELRQFPNKNLRDSDIWFLQFTDKLQSYNNDVDSLSWMPIDKKQIRDGKNIWDGEAILSAIELWNMSDVVLREDIQDKWLTLGRKNHAPTEEDPKNHTYYLSIKPFNTDQWIISGLSIGGGFAERGGTRPFSRNELDDFDKWEHYCILSGCSWIIPLIKNINATDDKVIDDIISQYRREQI